MIKNNNLGALMGAPVLGKDDERIGTVGQIFVDPATDQPNWMTVHTGLFGRRETFVPLQDAEWDHERLRVDIDKETIKAAPRIDTDEALSPEDEENLYRYYAVHAVAGDAQAQSHVETDRVTETDRVPETDRFAEVDDRTETDRFPERDRAATEGGTVESTERDERPGRLKRFVATEREPDPAGTAERDAAAEPEPPSPRHAKTD